MAQLIKRVNNNRIVKFSNYKRSPIQIKEKELPFFDKLLNDGIINRLLCYEGYSPAMRDIFPSNLFRAELLKAIKYPEISYRKFCTEEYFGLDRKQNRVFMGLSLSKKEMIDHTQLCTFRSSLSFIQQVNLLVHILHHFFQSGLLGDSILHMHGIDSTELACDCKRPLVSLNIKGKRIRIYEPVDLLFFEVYAIWPDIYVIGYRLHTPTAIDAKTGHSFPLVSLLAPANHHDNDFLPFLVNLTQAMGTDLQLITADEAYHNKDGSLFEERGVIVTTPSSSTVSLPENTDANTGARVSEIVEVRIDDLHLDGSAQIHLLGKGKKHRSCPLWPENVAAVQAYLETRCPKRAGIEYVFLNANGAPITRFEIRYVTNKYKVEAQEQWPSMKTKKVSPHTIRHTTAMHLLRSGNDINMASYWLRHTDINTTHVYLEIDMEMKRRMIEKASAPVMKEEELWHQPDIMAWLNNHTKGHQLCSANY